MMFGSRNSEDNEESEAEVPSDEQSSDSEELDESENGEEGDEDDQDRRDRRRSSRLRSHRHRYSRRDNSNMRVTRNSTRMRDQQDGGERRLLTRRSRAELEENDDFETHFIDDFEPHASRRVRNPNYSSGQNDTHHQTVRRRGRPPRNQSVRFDMGEEIEAISGFCTRCNTTNATVRCMNEDCSKIFHSQCAEVRGVTSGGGFTCFECIRDNELDKIEQGFDIVDYDHIGHLLKSENLKWLKNDSLDQDLV